MAHELQVRVGRRITQARLDAGLTQTELAYLTGHAARTVQTWEAGERQPRTKALEKIVEATGRPVSWFYADGDSEQASA